MPSAEWELGDWQSAVTVLAALVAVTVRADTPVVPRPDLSRAAQVVEAVVIGTHAYQIRLARVAGKGSDECWVAPGLADDALEALVAHQAGLFASNRLALRDWIAGRDHMRFDPARDLYPLLSAPVPLDKRLPVNVFTERAAAASHKPIVDVRSVASLYQLILEVERDGDELQDAFAFFIGLGLPVYAGQLGLPGDDASLAAFGATLAPLTCAAPFATDANAWRDAGRKVWNWGEKHLGVRDASVVARELSTTPEVRRLVNRLRSRRSRARCRRGAFLHDGQSLGIARQLYDHRRRHSHRKRIYLSRHDTTRPVDSRPPEPYGRSAGKSLSGNRRRRCLSLP